MSNSLINFKFIAMKFLILQRGKFTRAGAAAYENHAACLSSAASHNTAPLQVFCKRDSASSINERPLT